MGQVRRSHEVARKIGNPRLAIAESSGAPTFKIVRHRNIKESSVKANFLTESENQDRSCGEYKPDDMLFPCPEEGYVKAYSRFANLQTHLDTGKHQMMLEQETLYDKAKREYSSKLTEGRSRIPSVQVAAQSKRDGLPPLPMGWALKKIKKKVRFTKKQTEFLTDHFKKGSIVDGKAIHKKFRKP